MSNKEVLRTPSSVTDILREEFGVGTKISVEELGTRIGIIPVVLERIMDMENFSYSVCMRLGKFFGQTPEFWWNIQCNYSMLSAKGDLKIQAEVAAIIPWECEEVK